MKLLKINEAAELLAISKHFTRKLIAQGQIKVVRIGRCVRLRQSDIDHIVSNGGIDALKGAVHAD